MLKKTIAVLLAIALLAHPVHVLAASQSFGAAQRAVNDGRAVFDGDTRGEGFTNINPTTSGIYYARAEMAAEPAPPFRNLAAAPPSPLGEDIGTTGKDKDKDPKKPPPTPGDPKAVAGAAIMGIAGALLGFALGGPIGACIGFLIGAVIGAMTAKVYDAATQPKSTEQPKK